MAQEKTAEIIDLSASRAVSVDAGVGEFLKAAREAAGLHIVAVSDATNIKQAHLTAIEAGDAASLPATPYAVGFVKVYAGYLGLDAAAIAAQYKQELTDLRAPAAEEAAPRPSVSEDVGGGVKAASLIGILLIGGFAVWVAFQIAGGNRAADPAAAEPAPRVSVSRERAEPPRPRASLRISAPGEYDVTPIPPAPGAEGAVVDAGVIEAETDKAATSANEGQSGIAPAPAAEPAASGSSGRDGETISNDAANEASLTQPASIPMLAPLIAPIEPPVESSADAERAAPAPVIVEARLIRSVGPDYPVRCARAASSLETVSLVFDVTAAGRTANPRVASATDGCFEGAAITAIGKWRFDPRTVDGAARPQQGLQATLNFRK
ncbi:MAG: helix-turn-helix domain-containing protein [Pseudomonadota bacterium]